MHHAGSANFHNGLKATEKRRIRWGFLTFWAVYLAAFAIGGTALVWWL